MKMGAENDMSPQAIAARWEEDVRRAQNLMDAREARLAAEREAPKPEQTPRPARSGPGAQAAPRNHRFVGVKLG